MISIIIPAYNVNPYLEETCRSVIAQTYQEWEALIIDDGSTDATPKIAQEMSARDPRFRVIRQANAGVSAARNTGLRHSLGEFILFSMPMISLVPAALNDLLTALQAHPDCVLSWGKARFFRDVTHEECPTPWKNYHATGNAWLDMLVHDFLPVGSFCLRRALLPAGCTFNITLSHAEDRDFLLRVLRDHPAVPVPQTTLLVRLRYGSASSNYRKAIDGELTIMKHYLDDPAVPAAVRRRAFSALAFRCAVIAGFTGRRYGEALIWYLKAIFRDPLNGNNYLLPLRKALLILRSKLCK